MASASTPTARLIRSCIAADEPYSFLEMLVFLTGQQPDFQVPGVMLLHEIRKEGLEVVIALLLDTAVDGGTEAQVSGSGRTLRSLAPGGFGVMLGVDIMHPHRQFNIASSPLHEGVFHDLGRHRVIGQSLRYGDDFLLRAAGRAVTSRTWRPPLRAAGKAISSRGVATPGMVGSANPSPTAQAQARR